MSLNEDENYREFLKVIQLRDRLLADPSKQNDTNMKRLKIEKRLRQSYNENSDCTVNARQGRYDLISEENLKELYTPVAQLSQAFVENYKSRRQRELENASRESRGSKTLGTKPVSQNNESNVTEPNPENIMNLNQFIQQYQKNDTVDSNTEPQPVDAQAQLQFLQNIVHLQNQQQARLMQTQAAINNGMSIPFQTLEQLQLSLAQQQQLQQLQLQPQFYPQHMMTHPPPPPMTSPPPPPPPPPTMDHTTSNQNPPLQPVKTNQKKRNKNKNKGKSNQQNQPQLPAVQELEY
ncbi:hypothetical protein WICPIJ_009393 [Wickerhamomyces pijperi]|uniref:Uncharacterized protein n=1 Tax=Wickerhamomyces pijperi TaxID=599730 RepID=A0A9P8PMN8_WICPI|nr:hypothetical protein WICPIJ_009393 [Wickerhamomyces pijperi]